MDSLSDILADKNFEEPDEIAQIKNYVKTKYNSSVRVSLSGGTIIISASSAALATTLRLDTHNLAAQVNTSRKIRIRIS